MPGTAPARQPHGNDGRPGGATDRTPTGARPSAAAARHSCAELRSRCGCFRGQQHHHGEVSVRRRDAGWALPRRSALCRAAHEGRCAVGLLRIAGAVLPNARRLSVCPQNEAAQEMDVRWPSARLALQPQHAQTYPEVPVTASLEFPPTTCFAAAGAVIPELWLELLYCGHSPAGCTDSNATNTQV